MDVMKLARRLVETPTAKLLQKAIDKPKIKELIIRLNTEDQLRTKNEDSNGVKLASIGGGYTAFTMQQKGISDPTRVTLFDTGAYYASFRVVALGSGDYAIDSNSSIHGDDLEDRYGENLAGLQKQNSRIANKAIDKQVVKNLLRA